MFPLGILIRAADQDTVSSGYGQIRIRSDPDPVRSGSGQIRILSDQDPVGSKCFSTNPTQLVDTG